MTKLLSHPQVKPLLPDAHFPVDGTLIEAWASQKSFRAKDGSDNEGDGADFRGAGGFLLNLIACNLIRIPKLVAAQANAVKTPRKRQTWRTKHLLIRS